MESNVNRMCIDVGVVAADSVTAASPVLQCAGKLSVGETAFAEQQHGVPMISTSSVRMMLESDPADIPIITTMTALHEHLMMASSQQQQQREEQQPEQQKGQERDGTSDNVGREVTLTASSSSIFVTTVTRPLSPVALKRSSSYRFDSRTVAPLMTPAVADSPATNKTHHRRPLLNRTELEHEKKDTFGRMNDDDDNFSTLLRDNLTCIICLDPIRHPEAAVKECKHKFCKGCIDTWIETCHSIRCPLCRSAIFALYVTNESGGPTIEIQVERRIAKQRDNHMLTVSYITLLNRLYVYLARLFRSILRQVYNSRIRLSMLPYWTRLLIQFIYPSIPRNRQLLSQVVTNSSGGGEIFFRNSSGGAVLAVRDRHAHYPISSVLQFRLFVTGLLENGSRRDDRQSTANSADHPFSVMLQINLTYDGAGPELGLARRRRRRLATVSESTGPLPPFVRLTMIIERLLRSIGGSDGGNRFQRNLLLSSEFYRNGNYGALRFRVNFPQDNLIIRNPTFRLILANVLYRTEGHQALDDISIIEHWS